MKEVTKQRTYEYTVYEAIDGTQFDDQAECKAYEKSAAGVLAIRVSYLVKNDNYTEYSLFSTGSDDRKVIALYMPEEADRDAVMQYYFLMNPQVSRSEVCRKEIIETIEKAYKEHDLLLVSISEDRSEFYILTTRNTIIDNLTNLDKPANNENA